jgi:predicted RNA-binding Zn ribbon-like protein
MPSDPTTPPPGHENEVAAPAPGDLELVRSFLSLHDHTPGGDASAQPSATTVGRWLAAHALAEGPAPTEDLTAAVTVLEDLRSLVGETAAAPRDPEAVARLDAAARDAGIALELGEARFVPAADGVGGAIGRLLGIAFLARRDGSWARLRTCANDDCRTIFFDRSKNRSGRWCDMRSCGNQAKVRAYRARHRSAQA